MVQPMQTGGSKMDITQQMPARLDKSRNSGAVIVRCEHCKKTMTRGRFGTRRFCSNACRQAHYRTRKNTA